MMRLPGINFASITAFVWNDDLRRLTGVRRAVVFVLRVAHLLFRELLGGELNLRAMSLVYTTLLSMDRYKICRDKRRRCV